MHSPLDQFKIIDLIKLNIAGYDVSFSNSSLFMLIAVCMISAFFIYAIKKSAIVPGKIQSAAEIIYDFTYRTLSENTGGKGDKYMPFIFTLFMFVLTLNLLGNVPYGFTVTSHLSITFALAILVFVSVTIFAFVIHGWKFFSFFLPEGTPMFLAPLMVVIELFTYLTRPISLSVRLAANMMVGHILVFIVAGFILMMGYWGWIPIPFIIMFNAFEIFVAILQAYIFTILSCVYLNDAINLH